MCRRFSSAEKRGLRLRRERRAIAFERVRGSGTVRSLPVVLGGSKDYGALLRLASVGVFGRYAGARTRCADAAVQRAHAAAGDRMRSDAERRNATARLLDLTQQLKEARASLARYKAGDPMYSGLQMNVRGLEQLISDLRETIRSTEDPTAITPKRISVQAPVSALSGKPPEQELAALVAEVERVRGLLESDDSKRGLVSEVMRTQLNILITRIRQHCKQHGLPVPADMVPTTRRV